MKDLFTTMCLILLVSACAVGLFLFLEDHVLITTDQQSTPAPSLGDELIFTDGWTPVECQSDPHGNYDECRWVCVKDSVYRYCTPVVKLVVTEDGTR